MVVIMIISGKVFSMSKIRHELFREGIWVTAPFVLAPKINCEHVLLNLRNWGSCGLSQSLILCLQWHSLLSFPQVSGKGRTFSFCFSFLLRDLIPLNIQILLLLSLNLSIVYKPSHALPIQNILF